MKQAIVVMSDPQSGSEEALGRVFNALAAAYEAKRAGDEVRLQFQGAGTRWSGELTKPGHPAYDLYKAVEDTVAGVSCGCAEVFGASESVEASGLDLIRDNPIPGTSGVASLRRLAADGYSIVVF